jgi:hypothetical protein
MEEPLIFYENKKKISLNGYAFIDEDGHCFIIVYSENRRDGLIKYLDDSKHPIKYQYVNLPT